MEIKFKFFLIRNFDSLTILGKLNIKNVRKNLLFHFLDFLIAIVCLVICGLHGAIQENFLDWGQLHAYDTILLQLLNSKKRSGLFIIHMLQVITISRSSIFTSIKF